MIHLYEEERGVLTDPKLIKQYIMGGKGILTLESPSGKHHTYYFKKPRNEDCFPKDVIFVYCLHEGSELFYVGMIEQGKFRLTQSSRFLFDSEIVKGAKYIMKMASSCNDGRPMKLYHEGMCCRCGRRLTNPDSIKRGIGRKCLAFLDLK